jgi:hypothetical protein
MTELKASPRTLPTVSGVYLFVALHSQTIFYVGKAENFADRLVPSHHQVDAAFSFGCDRIYFACTPAKIAWHVEQKMISELRPVANGTFSAWWSEPLEKVSQGAKIGRTAQVRKYARKLYPVLVSIAQGVELGHEEKSLLNKLGIKPEVFTRIAASSQKNCQWLMAQSEEYFKQIEYYESRLKADACWQRENIFGQATTPKPKGVTMLHPLMSSVEKAIAVEIVRAENQMCMATPDKTP